MDSTILLIINSLAFAIGLIIFTVKTVKIEKGEKRDDNDTF